MPHTMVHHFKVLLRNILLVLHNIRNTNKLKLNERVLLTSRTIMDTIRTTKILLTRIIKPQCMDTILPVDLHNNNLR